ncbi:MAG: MATE family efflux transporter, partial [Parvularculaceae bacterium]|nr:MATE family efflux transporter [Parvularculaceae bacterium]
MRNLTQGSITGHLLSMGAFIAFTMLVQTAYLLVDLYFVSRLGPAAIAGVGAAGTVMLLTMALGQAIAVGVSALASRAIGAKTPEAADLVFNQGMGVALFFTAATLAFGYSVGLDLVARLGADADSAAAARAYFAAFLPALAVSYPTAVLGAALRASGVVRAPTAVQSSSILLNIALAPTLIAGWGTGVSLGVVGAGLASSIAAAFTLIAMLVIFPRVQPSMRLRRALLAPRAVEWAKLARIGAPSAAEFFMMFLLTSVIYVVISRYGSAAQAGFGVGSRVLQSIMLPAMAVAFSAAPIVGQNLGARLPGRVRETFIRALTISSGAMIALALLIHIAPSVLT